MDDQKFSPQDLVDIIPLEKDSADLAQQIIAEKDISKLKDLTYLFNLNQTKKNVLRVLKLNQLLDKVSDQMLDRFSKREHDFSNSDLLNYMTITQNAIDRANKSLNLVDEAPAIQINTQVNINQVEDTLDRESRNKIAEAIKAIMNRVNASDNKDISSLISDNQDEIIIESDSSDSPVYNNMLNEEEEDA